MNVSCVKTALLAEQRTPAHAQTMPKVPALVIGLPSDTSTAPTTSMQTVM